MSSSAVQKKTETKSQSILTALRALYPAAASELNFRNEYELVIAVVLSAQCTDKKVNEVTPTLFTRYPSFEALKEGDLAEVEAILRPINYYRTKARNVIALSKEVITRFSGELPRSQEDLITLPGVGRKTANVVTSERKIAPAIAVDTHVFRVSKRLGLSQGKNPLEVEQDLMALYPSDQWHELHHTLILHGRRACKARAPLCHECKLSPLCPSSYCPSSSSCPSSNYCPSPSKD